MFVRKYSDGSYYLCASRKPINSESVKPSIRNWWIVRYNSSGSCGTIPTPSCLIFPKELVGKRVRFRLEVID